MYLYPICDCPYFYVPFLANVTLTLGVCIQLLLSGAYDPFSLVEFTCFEVYFTMFWYCYLNMEPSLITLDFQTLDKVSARLYNTNK